MRIILNVENIGLVGHAVKAAQAFYEFGPEQKDMAVSHGDGATSRMVRRGTGTIVVTTREPHPGAKSA
jgi:hypothetical protein